MTEVRRCEICGKELGADKHKRCSACRKLIAKGNSLHEVKQKRYEKKDTLVCGHTDCKYAVKCNWVEKSKFTTCDYILMEGHSRPCLPTADCICYKKKGE